MRHTFYLLLILLPGFESLMPGGWTMRNPKDSKIQALAKFALSEHNKLSNSIYFFTLLRVVYAESQVVNGVNYKITVRIAETNCMKHAGKKGNACNQKTSNINEPLTCIYQIYEQAAPKNTKVTQISCTI